MKLLIRYLLFTIALATPLAAQAENSMLRIACEEYDAGAEVFVNGKFKGECPIDFQVAPGTLKLLVVKKVDNEYERVFEQEIRVGDGAVKKVEAALNERLNVKAKQRRNGPIADLVTGANNGNAFDQRCLGYRYSTGKDVVKNFVEAIKWIRKAADQGYAPAQVELGLMYEVYEKEGIAIDYVEALKWFRKAADQGYPPAQAQIGAAYEQGHGVEQNYAEALKRYRMAEAQGADAALGIGRIYQYGYGVERDEAEAIRWYRKALARGDKVVAKWALSNMGVK